MKAWTLTATAAAFAALAACTDDGPASFTDAETPSDPPTHITAEEFAAQLADGVMPNIDWIEWNLGGRSLVRFPLELRTAEEINAEYREKGRRLADGSFVPFSWRVSSKADYDLDAARNLIIQHLQPSTCPFVPCEWSYPAWIDSYQEVADRLGLPFNDPYDEKGRLKDEWRLR